MLRSCFVANYQNESCAGIRLTCATYEVDDELDLKANEDETK